MYKIKKRKEKIMEDKFYWDSFDCEIQCDEFENDYIPFDDEE